MDTYWCTRYSWGTHALMMRFDDGSPRMGCFLGEHTSNTLHTSPNTSSGTHLACRKIESGILSRKPSLWLECPGRLSGPKGRAGWILFFLFGTQEYSGGPSSFT